MNFNSRAGRGPIRPSLANLSAIFTPSSRAAFTLQGARLAKQATPSVATGLSANPAHNPSLSAAPGAVRPVDLPAPPRGRRATGAFLALSASLLALALLAPSAYAAYTHPFLFEINGSNTPAGSLGGPCGAAVDSHGDVYLSEVYGNRVVVFDSSGNYLTQISGLSTPCALAVDSSGNVYVANVFSNVEKFSPSSFPVTESTSYSSQGIIDSGGSHAVALDPSTENVYVDDGSYIAEYDSSGKPVLSSGNPVKIGQGTLTESFGLSVDASDGSIYASNGAGNQVDKFDSSGNLLHSFGSFGSEAPAGLAVDQSNSHLYVVGPEQHAVEEFDSSGNLLAKITGTPSHSYEQFTIVSTPGIDNSSGATAGDVYVPSLSAGRLDAFGPGVVLANATTNPASNLTPTTATLNGTVNPQEIQLSNCHFEYVTAAAFEATGYSDLSSGGTAPCVPAAASIPADSSDHVVSAEVSGLKAATTYYFRVNAANANGTATGGSLTYMTPPAAPLVSGSVTDVHSDSALLHAKINPGGGETTYDFEYGLGDCSANPCTAIPEADAGSSFEDQSVSAQLTGLTAGTNYHWRVIAKNVTGTTVLPDHTFTTFASGGTLTDPCPNAHVRQQTGSALLLDCRAYELVSAASAGGYDVESDLVPGQSPYAGYPEANSRVLYGVHDGGIPSTGQPTNRGVDPYIATRGENGWSTEYVGVPANNPFSSKPFSSAPTGTGANLETLAFGGSEGCSPCFAGGYTGIPVRLPNGELVQGMVASPSVTAPGPSAKPDGYIAKNLTANGEHFIFGSTSRFAEGGNEGGDVSIYDHNLKTGETHVVSNSPQGEDFPEALPCLQGAGSCHSPGDSNGISELDISKDGSHILLGQKVGVDADGNVYWHLYMDVGDSIRSIEITPKTTHGVLYDGMTANGSKVFFTTVDQLSVEDKDESADIYRADVGEGGVTLHLISTGTEGSGNSDACDPVSNKSGEHWNAVGSAKNCGVVAIGGGGGVAAESGSIFFLSPEKLTSCGCFEPLHEPTQNQPNLYFSASSSSTPQFIATLSPNDSAVLDAVKEAETRRTADFQVTSSGEFAAFTTTLPLSEYDNAGHSEVYRDEPSNERLDCISCDPTNAEAAGDASLASNGLSLTDDGRVFFNSTDALVPRDLDNKQDAYEWEAQGSWGCHTANGCIGLISTGSSPFDSSLLGVSADGADAYFFTRDTLVPQDQNGELVKIYDARELGGFPYVPPQPQCASSDECHGPGSPSPGSPDIHSNAKGGAADVESVKKNKKRHHQHRKRHRHPTHVHS